VKANDSHGYLRSAELARLCGLSTDSLRHYERKGILNAGRSANGYREYSLQSVDRIRLVQHALAVGFTLEELARLLKIRENGGAPCKEVRALAAAKLKDLDDQLQSLSVLRKELGKMLDKWDSKLARTKQGEQARLLDMLAASAPGLESAPTRTGFGSRGRRASRKVVTSARTHSR
jgi:DNA-binding transcriptional MerR regulator